MFDRYDVKSVSPRHVEALLVDALRLRDPAEVRRVLQGNDVLPEAADANKVSRNKSEEEEDEVADNDADQRRGKRLVDQGHTSGDDGRDMPELLAALSRAIEEEIRGSKGLFGLATGVLERLKIGARVTPFLRHGSVRRQDSAGAAPHGLTAGGMKKWWRCPRCHKSQVCLNGGFPYCKRYSVGSTILRYSQVYEHASFSCIVLAVARQYAPANGKKSVLIL